MICYGLNRRYGIWINIYRYVVVTLLQYRSVTLSAHSVQLNSALSPFLELSLGAPALPGCAPMCICYFRHVRRFILPCVLVQHYELQSESYSAPARMCRFDAKQNSTPLPSEKILASPNYVPMCNNIAYTVRDRAHLIPRSGKSDMHTAPCAPSTSPYAVQIGLMMLMTSHSVSAPSAAAARDLPVAIIRPPEARRRLRNSHRRRTDNNVVGI